MALRTLEVREYYDFEPLEPEPKRGWKGKIPDPGERPDAYARYLLVTGDQDRIRDLLSRYAKRKIKAFEWMIEPIVHRLDSDEEFWHHYRAIQSKLPNLRRDAGAVIPLVTRTNFEGCDRAIEIIRTEKNRKHQQGVMPWLCQIHSPKAVPGFVRMSLGGFVRAEAEEWLMTEGANAIEGLIPLATSEGDLADAARLFLSKYVANGHADLVGSIAATHSEETQRRLRAVLASVEPEPERPALAPSDYPPWLKKQAKRKLPRGFPVYLSLETLPPLITHGGHALGRDATAGLLVALKKSKPGSVDGAIASYRELLTEASLATFGEALLRAWLKENGPASHKFCIHARGLTGNASTAQRLAETLLEWPSEGRFARAVWGLEALVMQDTAASLGELSLIAFDCASAKLRARAQELLAQAADDRGLSLDALEDRVALRFGIDEETLDYGPRQFRFTLSPELKPTVAIGDQVLRALPLGGAKDDVDLVLAAKERFRKLASRLQRGLRAHRRRLENAMVLGRRWSASEFRSSVVDHPLFRGLARGLVWRAQGATFWLYEGGLEDAEGEAFTLPEDAVVELPHRLSLSEEEVTGWGNALGEHEILPAFEQLMRDTYAPKEEEYRQTSLRRFRRARIEPRALRRELESRAWERGDIEAGLVTSYVRRHRDGGRVVVQLEPGVDVTGELEWNEKQSIPCVEFFEPGEDSPSRLARVNAVSFSEVVRDLTSLVI